MKVCKRWHKFENFLEDMGIPRDDESIDRIDSNGHYTPKNCRWADRKTQNSNQKKNVYIEHDGKRMTVTSWAREIGVSQQHLWFHLKKKSLKEIIASKK